MHSQASLQTNNLKRFFVNLPATIEHFPTRVQIHDTKPINHLKNVLRAKIGEVVALVDADKECVYQATLTDLQKTVVEFQIEQQLPTQSSTKLHVTLAMALIKEQRWDWCLQKATELGVRTIQPLITDRTIIRLENREIHKKLERWQSVVRSAAEQSEGLFIPNILEPKSLTEYLHGVDSTTLRLVLQERGEARYPMKDVLSQQAASSIILAIGPEGGWAASEMTAFEQAGFIAVSLGQRILRAETAAMAAMAAIAYETEFL